MNYSKRPITIAQQIALLKQRGLIIDWLNAIDSQNTFVADFKKLLAMYPIVNTHSMGFPTGWQQEPLWS